MITNDAMGASAPTTQKEVHIVDIESINGVGRTLGNIGCFTLPAGAATYANVVFEAEHYILSYVMLLYCTINVLDAL